MSGEGADFMRRALALAAEGLGRVAPNPSVGCLIVAEGTEIAAARTGDGGRPHAEEAALALAGDRARGATIYVSLEPCASRSSGAASCAQRLVAAAPERVIVAARDPHPNASGAGLALLTQAGIAVEIGLCESEAVALNQGFFTRVATGKPLLAIADDGAGFDARLELEPGEDLDAALRRAGGLGLTRVWAPRHGPIAKLLGGD